MSCFNSNCYLPQPPRAWSRVQNSCSLTTDSDNNSLVRDPYTGQFVSPLILAERIAMLNKGNVLQYKSNSSNLTKAQKYSKIVKGQWVNRNITWATQSTRGYTNPNTTSLKRSGNVINVAIDPITGTIIGPTTDSITCLKPITPINDVLPVNDGGGSDEPIIPPPVSPTPASDTNPPIIPITPIEPIVIQDGGILICSIQENPCTGETKSSLAQQLCHPTTDSDVPGPIQDLCWNDGTQTWYPRSRYIMTNSSNKWPINAKLTSAIQIYPPILTANISECNINLSWKEIIICLPITYYDIYVNNILYDRVPSNVNTYNFIQTDGNYDIYVRAISNSINSDQSNIISITIISNGLIILGKQNIKTTTYSQSGQITCVIESTIQPKFGEPEQSNGVIYISSCNTSKPLKLNMLLIGAGGGGASGYYDEVGGGGGGSGAVTYVQDFIPPINTEITLNIGIGGGGRTPGNGGGGNSSGYSGSNTYIYYLSTKLISNGGGGGLGSGTTIGCGGGRGGDSIKVSEQVGPIYNGYGGSSAGGGYENSGGSVTVPCQVGTGYTSNGLPGSNGLTSQIGGDGANSSFPNLYIPLLGTVYFGGSGGGGGGYGGKAGNNGLGGLGGSNTTLPYGGTNATTYGAGGGGGGAYSGTPTTTTNVGGNGANGVIILWTDTT